MTQQQRVAHFSQPLTQYTPSRSPISVTEKETLYYTGQDLRDFREEAAALVKRVRKNQNLENQASYTSVIKRTYETCLNDSVPSASDIRLLVHWDTQRPSRRGVDQFCVSWVNATRRTRRYESIQSVIEAQNLARDIEPDVRADLLRSVSEQRSKVSHVYARVMGIADAAAAKEIYRTQTKNAFQVLDDITVSRHIKRRCTGGIPVASRPPKRICYEKSLPQLAAYECA